MKKNRSPFTSLRSTRALRLENLETRQLLSVNPLDVAVAGSTVEVVANEDFSNAVVELGELDANVATTGDLTFSASEVSSHYTMSWDPIADAQSYNVKISRDGGETWITYYRSDASETPTATSCAIKGVYVGSSYSYRVFAVNDVGKLFGDAFEGTFAPIKLSSSSDTYAEGKTISLALNGAENASASIKWFYATENGDLEIAEAAGLLEYAPSSADYGIKVVATGTGVSEGSYSVVSLRADESIHAAYTAETRVVALDWDDVEEAAIYRVLISRDGGETWITYAKPTESSVTVEGLYVGRSYAFRVQAYNDATKLNATTLVGSFSKTFAPVKITASLESYKAGDTIQITLNGADDADASIKWYYATENGDVEIVEAAGLLEYAPSADDEPIKVVATGTGVSKGSHSEVTIPVDDSFAIDADKTFTVDYDASSRLATLDWLDVEGAEIYRVLISRNDGETWLTYAKPTESSVTVEGVYIGRSYSFRIEAYDVAEAVSGTTLGGATLLETFSGTVAPVGLAVDVDEFRANDTINATFKGAPNASASIKWYYATENGDVEIAEAAGAYSYAPPSADHNVKVVLTGTGDSAGSRAEAVVVAKANHFGEFGEYVTLTRSVDMTWAVVEGATSYRVLKSSETSPSGWKKAATIVLENGAVVSDNAVLSDDGTKLTYNITMFNVGDPSDFRIVAVDAEGSVLDNLDYCFVNFGLELDHDAYNVEGDVLTAMTTPTTSVVYQWHSTSDLGATWNAIPGATNASFAISAADAALGLVYKVVATTETGERSVAFAAPDVLDKPIDLVVSVDANNILNMTFTASDPSAQYQVEYYYANATYPVWLKMPQVAYTDNGDGTVTATHVNGANYVDYDIRVRAIGEGVLSAWNGVTEPTSVFVTTTDDVVDPYDGQISFREAIMNYQTLMETFGHADPIVFDEGISTLYLNSPVTITSDVVISGTPDNHVTINSGGTHGAFVVSGEPGATTTLEVSYLDFVDGYANQGSAIYAGANAEVVVTGCSFADNVSPNRNHDGGLLYGEVGSSITVESSFFHDNGDMAINAYGDMTVVSSTIINNDHGIHYSGDQNDGKLSNSILWNNDSCNLIVFDDATLVVDHTLTSQGTVAARGYESTSPRREGTLKAVDYTFWLMGSNNTPVDAQGRFRNPDRSYSVTSYNYVGGFLIVNRTRSESIRLVDVGDNSAVTSAYDAAGNQRVVKYRSNVNPATVDLGAFEHQTTSNAIADLFAEGFFDEF